MKYKEFTILLTTHNTLLVLQKVAGIFSRYRANIEEMDVKGLEKNLSQWTINLKVEVDKMNKLVNQLNKIIEVVEVKII